MRRVRVLGRTVASWVTWRRRSAANSAPTRSRRSPGSLATTDRSLRECHATAGDVRPHRGQRRLVDLHKSKAHKAPTGTVIGCPDKAGSQTRHKKEGSGV